MKPGLPLEQVQQGVTEVIDELGFRLGSFLNEKDLQSNADKYEVAGKKKKHTRATVLKLFFPVFWWNIIFRELQTGYGSIVLQVVYVLCPKAC